MNDLGIEFDEQQIVWEQGLADRSTFTTDDFSSDRRYQATIDWLDVHVPGAEAAHVCTA